MELYKDKDLQRFIERISMLEYIQNSDYCSVKEIKKKFKWSKSELYRRLTEWERENLIVKDTKNKEKKYYSHFVVRKTSQLKIELLKLYDILIEHFTQRYNEIAKIKQLIENRNSYSKINAI